MMPVRNLDDLLSLGHGYQRAMILFAALKLGVFRGLASGECDAFALARRVGADPGKLSILTRRGSASCGLCGRPTALSRAGNDFVGNAYLQHYVTKPPDSGGFVT